MTAPIATNEPFELRAGLNWDWRRDDLSDYPASVYTLTYWFKKTGASGANFSVVASASGDAFVVAVAAATTAGYTAGDYTWVAVASDGTNSYEADRGTLKLLPKYSAASNLDDRSDARQIYDALVAAYKTYATSGGKVKSYTIGSRTMTFNSAKELLDQVNFWKAKVNQELAAERIANGLGANRVVVRF